MKGDAVFASGRGRHLGEYVKRTLPVPPRTGSSPSESTTRAGAKTSGDVAYLPRKPLQELLPQTHLILHSARLAMSSFKAFSSSTIAVRPSCSISSNTCTCFSRMGSNRSRCSCDRRRRGSSRASISFTTATGGGGTCRSVCPTTSNCDSGAAEHAGQKNDQAEERHAPSMQPTEQDHRIVGTLEMVH